MALQYALKVALSALVIVAVAELAKRSSAAGALLASLPLTSLLAFVWLYVDTGNAEKVATLCASMFWLVLPSLALFVVLPWLLRHGWAFWPGLAAAAGATVVAYLIMLGILARLGIEL
jgi:hypothetical protein